MVDEGCHPFQTIYKNNSALSSSLMMNEGPLLDEAALYQEALRDQIRTHHEDLLIRELLPLLHWWLMKTPFLDVNK